MAGAGPPVEAERSRTRRRTEARPAETAPPITTLEPAPPMPPAAAPEGEAGPPAWRPIRYGCL